MLLMKDAEVAALYECYTRARPAVELAAPRSEPAVYREVRERAEGLIAKSGGKVGMPDAVAKVLNADESLYRRYLLASRGRPADDAA